jgi:hypothetical protein
MKEKKVKGKGRKNGTKTLDRNLNWGILIKICLIHKIVYSFYFVKQFSWI